MRTIPVSGAVPVGVKAPRRALRVSLPLYLELAKARLSALVLFTAGVGFVLAAGSDVDWLRLGWALLGTALAAGGANALNEWWEVLRDVRMVRTRGRPLPMRRLESRTALVFGLTTGLGGPLLLAGCVNILAGLLALAALLTYVLLYTPLKVRTPLNTLVGAVVGALPPMIGWGAAAGRLDAGAWILGGILFLWQIPHFLALAWLYRDDYARGGFRMLPAVDPAGHLSGYVSVVYALVLVPVSAMLAFVGVTGWVYACGSLVLGAGLVLLGAALERQRSNLAARRLFLGSVIYLPLLLALMVVDRRPIDARATYALPSSTVGRSLESDATHTASLASRDGKGAVAPG